MGIERLLDLFSLKYSKKVKEARKALKKTKPEYKKDKKHNLKSFDTIMKKYQNKPDIQNEIAEFVKKTTLKKEDNTIRNGLWYLSNPNFEKELEDLDVLTTKNIITAFTDKHIDYLIDDDSYLEILKYAKQYKHKEEVFELFCDNLNEIRTRMYGQTHITNNAIKRYLKLIKNLDCERILQEINDELISFVTKISDCDEQDELTEKAANYLEENPNFLSQHKQEYAFTLLVLISEIEQPEKILELTDYQKSQICIAYDIANKNINPDTIQYKGDNGKNYLPEFYAGLNETLETDYDNLNKWCETIIDGLKEVALTGQSLSEIMSNSAGSDYQECVNY